MFDRGEGGRINKNVICTSTSDIISRRNMLIEVRDIVAPPWKLFPS